MSKIFLHFAELEKNEIYNLNLNEILNFILFIIRILASSQ